MTEIGTKVRITSGKYFGEIGVIVDNVGGYWGVQVGDEILYYRGWELESAE